jgi:two-component system, LuxR family, response regulator FixJ
MEGKPNKEIVYELSISMSTVEAHRRSLRKKLKASYNADLIKRYLTT